MTARSLTAPMLACIDLAQEGNGELVRYAGGYWAPRGRAHPRLSGEWAGTPTVQALVARGQARFSEHRRSRTKPVPVAIQLTGEKA